MLRSSVVLAACLVAAVCAAGPLPPYARAEIDELMSRLEGSGCEINRNGTWYPAADARSHLLRKLKYLEDRGAVHSAEQFIELGASKSSVSGRPYLIKCRGDPPVESSVWLTVQLQALRSSGQAGSAP
jgi:hypothetical protein